MYGGPTINCPRIFNCMGSMPLTLSLFKGQLYKPQSLAARSLHSSMGDNLNFQML